MRGSDIVVRCPAGYAHRAFQRVNHTCVSTIGRPGAPALIEGTIPLPGLAQLQSKSYLAQLYAGQHLSARQIARLTEVSRSTALAALRRCGIPKNGRNRTHPGQLPFGFDYQDYRLVKNQAEQGVIRLMRQGRAGGLSLRQIAGQLSEHPVPKQGRRDLAGQHRAPDPGQGLTEAVCENLSPER